MSKLDVAANADKIAIAGTRAETDSPKNKIIKVFEANEAGPLAMILCIEAYLVVCDRTHKWHPARSQEGLSPNAGLSSCVGHNRG